MNFKNKNILLTGFNGFKGAWMTLMLNHLGANVYGFSKNDKINFKVFRLKKYLKKYQFGDIQNLEQFMNFTSKTKFDYAIHFAAKSEVLEALKNPVETLKVNLIGTINFLNFIKKKKIPCIIATSDKCYENLNENKKFKENDKLNGDEAYSASKAAKEIIISPFIKTYKLNISTVRAGNVIGGGDFSQFRIIPDIIRGIFLSKKIKLRNPNHMRPWQNVIEINYNYLKLLSLMKRNKNLRGAWNFGPDKCFSVKNLVNIFLKLNSKKRVNISLLKKRNKNVEKKILMLDNKKVKKLRIKNILTINDSVKLTLEWFKKYYNKDQSIDKFSIQQIKNYLINVQRKNKKN